jgi:hypothetical protein
VKLPSCAATVKARKLAALKYSEQEEMAIETLYPQDIEFKASLTLETYRIPDPYHYYSRKGKLYSPITRQPVENSITTNDAVEEAELIAFQEIQRWFAENEEGVAIWISPASHRDESAKIIISQIVFDGDLVKKLLNRSVCLDLDTEECLRLAKRIAGVSVGSTDELRRCPLFLDEEQSQKLALIIKGYSPEQARLIKTEEDFRIKEALKAKIALGHPAPIGPYRPSCNRGSRSAFGVMFGDSLNISEAFFDCPKCHRAIPSGKGITVCPHCGARKDECQSECG